MEYQFITKTQSTDRRGGRGRALLIVGIVALIVAMIAEFLLNNYWSAVLIVPLIYLITSLTKTRGRTITRDTLARAAREGSEIRFDLLQAETVNKTSCDVLYIFNADALEGLIYRTQQNTLVVQGPGRKVWLLNGEIVKSETVGSMELVVAPMDAARIENVLGRQASYQ